MRRRGKCRQVSTRKSADWINSLILQGRRMPEPVSAKPVPKLRAKSATKAGGRPRPKTIHVDQDADVNTALQSRGPRGSISNISGTSQYYYLIACPAAAFVLRQSQDFIFCLLL